MANFNRVLLLGRLTRDPEIRAFSNGGKVAKFGFAVSNRKKNTQTGQWEDEPMFIDVDVFNRGEHGTLANVVEQYCKKGSQILIEGKLTLESWEDQTTKQKRQKHKVVADQIQLVDTKMSEGGSRPQNRTAPASGAASPPFAEESYESSPQDSGEIPF